jgi:hypothetical protein
MLKMERHFESGAGWVVWFALPGTDTLGAWRAPLMGFLQGAVTSAVGAWDDTAKVIAEAAVHRVSTALFGLQVRW